jgi:hypothetical protein
MFTRLKGKIGVRRIGRWLGWFAFILILVTLLTGYGITQWKIVDSLTFGLLGKATSQRWHESVGLLAALFLCLHVAIAVWLRTSGAPKEGQA